MRRNSARRRWSVARRRLRRRRPWLRRRERLPLPPRAWAEPGRRSSSPGAHRGQGCWNVGWRGGSWRGGNGGAGRGHCRRRSLRPRARHGMGAGEHALPAPGVQLPHGAHAAVQRPERRGGAQRHRGARLHETQGQRRRPTRGRTWPPFAARQEDSLSDAAGQPAVPSQPRSTSTSSPSSKTPTQHRHRPRGLPASSTWWPTSW